MPSTSHVAAAPAHRPAQEVPSANRAVVEDAMVTQVMQPAMGNGAWADLIAPAPPQPAGVDVGHAGGPWLADPIFQTADFLSGLSEPAVR